MKWIYRLFLICIVPIPVQLKPVLAQDVHPKKEVYADSQNWPATAPGDVELKNFRPFRAVYERAYKVGSGRLKGALRQDRIIVTAEKVSWHGKQVALINLVDSGTLEHDDTNARSFSMYANLEDLGMLFEIGPIPGKAKDYYIANILKDKGVVSYVMSESGQSQMESMDISKPGFGPGTWAMACMDLKEGRKIRLDPFYSPKGNVIAGRAFGRVLRQDNYEGAGKKFRAWVIESMYGLSSSRVQHRYLIAEPPYYLGTESVDLETGEKKDFVRLKSFEYLDNGAKQ